MKIADLKLNAVFKDRRGDTWQLLRFIKNHNGEYFAVACPYPLADIFRLDSEAEIIGHISPDGKFTEASE